MCCQRKSPHEARCEAHLRHLVRPNIGTYVIAVQMELEGGVTRHTEYHLIPLLQPEGFLPVTHDASRERDIDEHLWLCPTRNAPCESQPQREGAPDDYTSIISREAETCHSVLFDSTLAENRSSVRFNNKQEFLARRREKLSRARPTKARGACRMRQGADGRFVG